ncbi:MAG: ScyD/ScyE family protein, partial [Verrucomicrobiota bacterium]|nr:ScyD/ScyE family protein [Verrucomicrobiota bacterium]
MRTTTKNLKNHWTRRVAAAAFVSSLMALAGGNAMAQCTELVSGLLRPIGITQSKKDNLLVSESGTATPNTGRISIVDLAGTRRTLVSGLPSGISFEANAPSGSTGLFLRGRTLYLAVGVGDAVMAGPGQGLTAANPNPSSPLFSSILAIHFSAAVEKNTQGFTLTLADQEKLASGQPVVLSNGGADTITIEMIVNFPNFAPDPRPSFAENVANTNPFALVALGDRLFVTDGGQNLVWRVDLTARQFSVLTRFGNIPNPQFNPNPPPPSFGGPTLEAVPTGIESADGQLLVTLFRGFPFPAGTSTVQRVDPLTGSQSAFISGLKTAIDIL